MADHPLRPATDRRLGEPLPHQLANRTRANPSAINLSPLRGLSGISSSFPELFRTKGHVPTRYSPVCHSRIAASVRLACVKPAASVRSEPGSNSQVVERRSQPITHHVIDGVHDGPKPIASSKRVTGRCLFISPNRPKPARTAQGHRRPRFSFFRFSCQRAASQDATTVPTKHSRSRPIGLAANSSDAEDASSARHHSVARRV